MQGAKNAGTRPNGKNITKTRQKGKMKLETILCKMRK